MRLPSPRAFWLASLALLGLAAVAAVVWRSAPSHPPPAVHRVAQVRAKAVPKPKPPTKVLSPPSAYALEQQMTPRELLSRWDLVMQDASRCFDVPEPWIRAVLVAERGGSLLAAG